MATSMLTATARRFHSSQVIFRKRRSFTHGNHLGLQSARTESNCGSSPSFLMGTLNIPSMRDPFPGFEQITPLPDFTRLAETKLTTLSNGIRIASEDSIRPLVTVGLFVDSGCIHESSNNYGVTHLLEKMAFKCTRNRTQRQLVQELESIGVNVSASSGRDQMTYTGDGIKTFMPQIVEILIDCVRNPIFNDWDVKEELMKIQDEVREFKRNPQFLLAEALHSVGYSGDYSKSLVASEPFLDMLSAESLHDYVNENFTADRMVLAASGADHHDFVAVSEPLLSDLPKFPLHHTPKFDYVGGDWREQADTPCTHFALAFEVPRGWENEKLANALTVLKFLLGGGGSFSTGGPGKGMYSRLYAHVLNKYQEFQSINAFSSIYNHTGIFGIHASVDSGFVSHAVDIACEELISIATRGQVTDQEFRRAKNATISQVLMSLESTPVVADDIGRQILSYGHRCIAKLLSFVSRIYCCIEGGDQ